MKSNCRRLLDLARCVRVNRPNGQLLAAFEDPDSTGMDLVDRQILLK